MFESHRLTRIAHDVPAHPEDTLVRDLYERERTALQREARSRTILWTGGAAIAGFLAGVYGTLMVCARAAESRETKGRVTQLG